MRVVKITATYDEDERENIVFVGRQNSDGKLDENSEYFGYVTDWTDDRNNYLRYPFIMEQIDENRAIIDWCGWDLDTKTTIDVFQRRIVVGEKFIRTEANERFSYTVKSVATLV